MRRIGRDQPPFMPPMQRTIAARLPARIAFAGAGLAFCLGIAGCGNSTLQQLETAAPPSPATQATRTQGLVALLADTGSSDAIRMQADATLKRDGKTHARDRLVVLKQLLYAPGNDAKMRIYAMNQLVAANKTLAGRALMRYLPDFNNRRVLQRACALAGELKDPRLIAPLIKSLDRPAKTMTLRARPEAVVLPKLSGMSLGKTLANMLQHGRHPNARIAALDVLCKLKGASAVRRLILSSRAGSVFLTDLRWWVRKFREVPRGPTEIMWVQHLHMLKYHGVIKRAAAAEKTLDGQKDFVMAPRFVGLLSCLPPRDLLISRRRLLSQLTTALGRYKHLRRPEPYPKGNVNPTLQANAARLSRCDLLSLRLLMQALATPRFVRAVYRLGMQDMTNTKTEFGGLLALRHPPGATPPCRVLLRYYPPLYTGNDARYVTGDQLLLATPLGLAQFVMHFQKIRNGRFVGPAAPDLAYVHRVKCNDVVFTSVGPNKFDATFYTPAGAVVDMGMFTRR